MHAAYRRYSARTVGLTEPPFALPAGSSDWQACMADWYCGEFGSMPLPCCNVTEFPLDPDVGSGKLGTPWDRMQAEKVTAPPEELAWPDACPEACEGELELEPEQAVVNMAMTAATKDRKSTRLNSSH